MTGHWTRRFLLSASAMALLLTSCNRTTQVGEVHNPRVVLDRDGAASAVLGGKVFWAFGDTFAATGGVHSSGAYADPASPTVVTEPLVDGVPHQLVPFTADEAADDRTATDGSQWVIWPSAVIPTSADQALIFSTKFHATPGGWVDSSLVISRIDAGSTESTRVADILPSPASNYATGIYADGAYVYLHDCGGANLPPELGQRLIGHLPVQGALDLLNPTPGSCRLARVPLARATDANAYRYYTGTGWSASQDSAKAVVPGTNSGLSVSWNPSLKKYVALSNPGFSPDIMMSTSQHPEGPWSKPTKVFSAPTDSYAVRIHPHLGSADQSTMGVTYFRMDQDATPGAVVLVDLTVS